MEILDDPVGETLAALRRRWEIWRLSQTGGIDLAFGHDSSWPSLQELCIAMARWTADNSDAVLHAQHACDGKDRTAV